MGKEPHVRHDDGTLFKPDITVHLTPNSLAVGDSGVNWEGDIPLGQLQIAKKKVYDNVKFREAAAKKWPNKEIIIEPIIIGARGVWPNCNTTAEQLPRIPAQVKVSILRLNGGPQSMGHLCLMYGVGCDNPHSIVLVHYLNVR